LAASYKQHINWKEVKEPTGKLRNRQLLSRGDQQPEQEWSQIRSLAFFLGAGVDPESSFCQKTGAGSGAGVKFKFHCMFF